jgi:hypothetical protein
VANCEERMGGVAAIKSARHSVRYLMVDIESTDLLLEVVDVARL